MRVRPLLILAGLVALFLAACTDVGPTPHPTSLAPTLAPEPTTDPEGDATHGADLFAAWQCAGCHGPNAEGQVGPALAGMTLSLTRFTTAVRQTRPPKPAFSEAELSEADVRDIYTWAQSLERPAEAAEGVDLAPGEILGMQLYTESGCDSCHGAFAQGSADAAALVDYAEDADTFLDAMESTTEDIPEHNLGELDRDLMRRLHGWLQEGANVDSGC
jgi:mono/diheme cytochrome c family protein